MGMAVIPGFGIDVPGGGPAAAPGGAPGLPGPPPRLANIEGSTATLVSRSAP